MSSIPLILMGKNGFGICQIVTVTLLRNKFSADSRVCLPTALCPCVPCFLNHPVLSFCPSWRGWPILPFLPVLLSISPVSLRFNLSQGFSDPPNSSDLTVGTLRNVSVSTFPRLSVSLFSAST